MGQSHVEHDPDRRRGRQGQLADFPCPGHRVLDHQGSIARVHLKNRHRDPGIGIEVALALVHAQPAPEHVSDQVLGRRFSGAAGDRHNRQRPAAQAIGGDVEEGLPRVLDHDDRGVVHCLRWLLTQDAGGPAIDRLRNETMAVVLLAAQGDEEAAWLHLARIGEQRAQRNVRRTAEEPAARRLHHVLYRHRHSPLIVAGRITARSATG